MSGLCPGLSHRGEVLNASPNPISQLLRFNNVLAFSSREGRNAERPHGDSVGFECRRRDARGGRFAASIIGASHISGIAGEREQNHVPLYLLNRVGLSTPSAGAPALTILT